MAEDPFAVGRKALGLPSASPAALTDPFSAARTYGATGVGAGAGAAAGGGGGGGAQAFYDGATSLPAAGTMGVMGAGAGAGAGTGAGYAASAAAAAQSQQQMFLGQAAQLLIQQQMGSAFGGGVGGAGGGGGGGGAAFGATGGPGGSGAGAAFTGADYVDSALRNPLTQVGVQLGRDFVQTNVARYAPGASVAWQSLRYHFDVSNAYVRSKLRRILFPFLTTQWKRTSAGAGTLGPDAAGRHSAPDAAGVAYAAPAHDENAPDLYIPTMAFITYVLVCGLLKGTQMKFHPEVLVQTSSSALLLQIVEVGLLRAGFFALAAEGAGLLDLVAYTGYKYVGLTINTAAGLLLGPTAYYLCLLYTGSAMAFVLVNSLSPVVVYAEPRNIAPGVPGPPLSAAAKMQRTNLVIFAGLLQLVLMWLLGGF